MYIEDLRRLLTDLEIWDYRVVNRHEIEVHDENIKAKTGNTRFHSMTIRAFKLENLEDRCEDYGQVAVYQGTIAESPHAFVLDNHHFFETQKPMLVCGNTAAMLENT